MVAILLQLAMGHGYEPIAVWEEMNQKFGKTEQFLSKLAVLDLNCGAAGSVGVWKQVTNQMHWTC